MNDLIRSQRKNWHFSVEKEFVLGQNSDLSGPARFLYIILLSFVSPDSLQPFPGMQLLSNAMGSTEKTVLKYRQELESRGWLSIERTRNPKTSQFGRNIYNLLDGPHPVAIGKKAGMANLPTKSNHKRKEGTAVPAEPPAVLLNDLPDTSVPKFSGPVRDFANWSRSKGFHVRLRLSPTDIKYAKGGGPGGWSRDTLLAWESAFQQFIKRVPAQQVGSVLSLYIKEHVLLTQERNAPVCQTFLTFLERFDWIDRTVRQLKQFRKRESGTEDGQPEWTPAE
jgi:hypothetical protein